MIINKLKLLKVIKNFKNAKVINFKHFKSLSDNFEEKIYPVRRIYYAKLYLSELRNSYNSRYIKLNKGKKLGRKTIS